MMLRLSSVLLLFVGLQELGAERALVPADPSGSTDLVNPAVQDDGLPAHKSIFAQHGKDAHSDGHGVSEYHPHKVEPTGPSHIPEHGMKMHREARRRRATLDAGGAMDLSVLPLFLILALLLGCCWCCTHKQEIEDMIEHPKEDVKPEVRPVQAWGEFPKVEGSTMTKPRYLPMQIDGKTILVKTDKEGEYMVTNARQNPAPGLQYRLSDDLNHRDSDLAQKWGTKVTGTEDNGFLRVLKEVPTRKLKRGSVFDVSKVVKIDDVIYLQVADKLEWKPLHNYGVQTYYPVRADGTRDFEWMFHDNLESGKSEPEHKSKFISITGHSLTHMALTEAGTCNVTRKPLEAGSIVLRAMTKKGKETDFNMSYAEAERLGIKEEYCKSPDGDEMVPVAITDPLAADFVCRGVDDDGAGGWKCCRKAEPPTKAGAASPAAPVKAGAAPPAAPVKAAAAGPGTVPVKAVEVVFVPKGKVMSDFTICAKCMEKSPEFGNQDARNAAAAFTAPPGQEDKIWVYVPVDKQKDMGAAGAGATTPATTPRVGATTPGGGATTTSLKSSASAASLASFASDASGGGTTVHAPVLHDSIQKVAYTKYQRFIVEDKKTVSGVVWLQLAHSEGWVSTVQKGAQVVFPLSLAVQKNWLPHDKPANA